MNTDTSSSTTSKWWLIILIGVPSAQATTITGTLGSGTTEDQIVFWCEADPAPHTAGRGKIKERKASGDLITDATSVNVRVYELPAQQCAGALQADNDNDDSVYSSPSETTCGSQHFDYLAKIKKTDTNRDFYHLQIHCMNQGSDENPTRWDYTLNQ